MGASAAIGQYSPLGLPVGPAEVGCLTAKFKALWGRNRGNRWNQMKPLSDIGSSLLHVRIWMSLALSDVASKYRRTVLGPVWIVLGQVAVIIGIYLLRHSISPSVIGNFLLYLSASLPIWGLVSS